MTPSGVYVNYACNQTYDFEPSRGAAIWHHSGPCEGGGGANTAASNGKLYAPGEPFGEGIVLDAANGEVVGPFASSNRPPSFAGDVEIIDNGSLKAENADTNQVLWSFSGDGGLGGQLPVTYNNIVVAASTLGNSTPSTPGPS